MKPKRIQIDYKTPIEEWADENKGLIMESIYENVFEFMDSDEDDRVVLQVQPANAPEKIMRKLVESQVPINIDFLISKQDIDYTLNELLKYMVSVEEYEKCAEIVKLQNREETPKPKKRSKKKSI